MDILATQVMRRSVRHVPPSMTLPELERAFVEYGVSGIPVVDGEQVVGVVTRSDIVRTLNLEHQTAQHVSDFYLDTKDGFHEIPMETPQQITARVGERMEHLKVSDLMHRQIFAVRPDQPLRQIAEILVDHRIHRVLVTLNGRLLGIISAIDFVRLYAQGRIRPDEQACGSQ